MAKPVSHLYPTERAFQLLKKKLETETHRPAATDGGYSKGLTEHLKEGNTAVDDVLVFFLLQVVDDYKGFSFKHLLF